MGAAKQEGRHKANRAARALRGLMSFLVGPWPCPHSHIVKTIGWLPDLGHQLARAGWHWGFGFLAWNPEPMSACWGWMTTEPGGSAHGSQRPPALLLSITSATFVNFEQVTNWLSLSRDGNNDSYGTWGGG